MALTGRPVPNAADRSSQALAGRHGDLQGFVDTFISPKQESTPSGMNRALAVFLEIPVATPEDLSYIEDTVTMQYGSLVDYWVQGLRAGTLGMAPLKPDVVARKTAMHDLNPQAPLYAHGALIKRIEDSHPTFHITEQGGELVLEVGIAKEEGDRSHVTDALEHDMFFGNKRGDVEGRTLPVPMDWIHDLFSELNPEKPDPLAMDDQMPFPEWEEEWT